MSLADIIIVTILVGLVALVVYVLIRNHNLNCAGCAYAKNCETYCVKIKPEDAE